MSEGTGRLYSDLSWLWPLWSGPDAYHAESELFAKLIKRHSAAPVVTILDIACGGGKNSFNLKTHFSLTGVDASERMLALARTLNPDCEFLLGDMRDLNLARQFDAVFINDGVSHMQTRAELLAAFRSAFRHVRPGGVVVTYPDITKETFVQNETVVDHADGPDKPADLDVVFVRSAYDPDPNDESYEDTIIYLIRERGRTRIEHDQDPMGLFGLSVWRECLSEAGFDVFEEKWDGAEGPCHGQLPIFVCTRPRDA